MHTTHLSACFPKNYPNLARKVYKKPTKRHYCDNIEYRDILTHDNRHQLFLISPIPSRDKSLYPLGHDQWVSSSSQGEGGGVFIKELHDSHVGCACNDCNGSTIRIDHEQKTSA